MPLPQPQVPGRFDHSPNPIQQAGAVATIKAFTADGLFIGQSEEFFALLQDLAREADEATHKSDAD